MKIKKSIENRILTINDWSKKNKRFEVTGERRMLTFGLSVVNKPMGRRCLYLTKEEARIAHNKQALISYHNDPQRIQYFKDIDKNKSWCSDAKYRFKIMDFFSKHYDFNYFVTLTIPTKKSLDFKDRQVTYNAEEYDFNMNQDKYQYKYDSNYDYIKNCVKEFLSLLGDAVEYYVLTFEGLELAQPHCHLAIYFNIQKISNVSQFLKRKWLHGYSHIKMIKRKNHEQQVRNVLSYIVKNITKENTGKLFDSNIDFWKKRIFDTEDLTTHFRHFMPNNAIGFLQRDKIRV